MNFPVYLDYNATTPVDPRVLEAMLPYFTEKFGNAASKTHVYGWIAEEAVDNARSSVARLIGAEEQEVYFTSGATEGLNAALKGIAATYNEKGSHIVTLATEHKAVLDTCKFLQEQGCSITSLPVNRDGLVDLDLLKQAITDKTIAVVVMYANNETGVIQPVKKIADIVHEKGSLFICDATQAVGKVMVDVNEDRIAVLVLSAHKLYGPKGVGAMYVRRKQPRVILQPLMHGGGHERGLRSGTLNVPSIVGLGKACDIAGAELWDDSTRISRLRTILEQRLEELGDVHINGSIRHRLPNTTNLSFGGLRNNSLVKHLQNVAVATGSACTSASMEPSHVLKAMNVSDEMAYNSIRFSLGRYTTEEEMLFAVEEVKLAVLNLRNL